MARVIADFRIKGLKKLRRQVDAYGEKIFPRAASAAINRTARTVRTQSVRDVAKTLGLKQKTVRDKITVRRKANPRQLRAVVGISATAIELRHFGARQTRKGTTAKVFGKRKLFEHAFIVAKLGRNVFFRKRVGGKIAGRLPIKLLFGPNAVVGFLDDRVERDRRALVQETLRKRLQQELNFRVGKLKSL